MGLPVKNDLLLAITWHGLELNGNLAHIKNQLSPTFESITTVFIRPVICHVIMFLKILNIWQIGGEFKKRNQSVVLIHIKYF